MEWNLPLSSKKTVAKTRKMKFNAYAAYYNPLPELHFQMEKHSYTGQAQGIDFNRKSNITGFITVPDDKFCEIETPNGKVSFVEFVGATDSELKAVQSKEIRVRELYAKIGSDITSYSRASVI